MIANENIDQFFKNYFATRIDNDTAINNPNWQDSLLDVGALDSFGIVELVCEIEKKFQIKIEDDEITLSNFNSVSAIASLVNQKLRHT